MKTKLNLPPVHSLPSSVVEQLYCLTTQKEVSGLFLSNIITTAHTCIIVLLNSQENARNWQNQKWVKKAFLNHGITILILGQNEIASHRKQGTLFLNVHTQPQKAIYVAAEYQFTMPSYAKSKKRFKQHIKRFHNEINLWSNQIRTAEKSEAFCTVFNGYIALFSHYFHYIEQLVLGCSYDSEELNTRLHRLCFYFPDLQKAFVKSSATSYFLIDTLLTVLKGELDDLSFLDLEYLPEIATKERLFAEVTANLFKEIKVEAKKANKTVQPTPKTTHDDDVALQLVIKNPAVEAIYEYEQKVEQGKNNQKKNIRYWLIVGEGISNHNLSNWYEAIKQHTQETVEVVPIAHTQIWIQKNLFENQLFFQKVMQPALLIYQKEPNFPQIHWQAPYTFYSPDLDFYRNTCLKQYETIQRLRNTDKTIVHEGIGMLYSSFITTTCQVLIYAKLSYNTNHLPITILWRITELAEERILTLRYLQEKLSFNLINCITSHQSTYRNPKKIKPEDLPIMDQLTEQLKIIAL